MNTYIHDQTENAPPAQPADNLEPIIATPLELRDYFPHERDFEAYIIKDLKSTDSKFAQLLDIDVHPDGIAPQQPHFGMRPDILMYPNRDHEPGTAEVSTEISMETWNTDHTNRHTIYALDHGTHTAIAIAPEFPAAQIERLEQLTTQIGRRLIIVEARLLNIAGRIGLDFRVISTSKTADGSERNVELMKAVQAECRSNQDFSLNRVTVQPDGRIELNTKEVRLLIRANRDNAQLSLYLSKADETTANRLYTQLLQDKNRIEQIVGKEIFWGGDTNRDGGLRLSIRLPYPNRINEMTGIEFQETIRDIAKTYLAFKTATKNVIKY